MTQNDAKEKNLLLATAIASGTSALEAAERLDLSRTTVTRRLAEPEFRRLVCDIRGEMAATALGRISEKLTRAADSVGELLDDPHPLNRLRAARILFTFAQRMRETVDLERRIHDLEEELARKLGEKP